MSRIGDMKQAKLKVELSYPGGQKSGTANIRVSDKESDMLIADITLTAQQFFNMMRGFIDGCSAEFARVLSTDQYSRVGKKRYHWTRRIGHSVSQLDAEAWAETVRVKVRADTADVDSRQGGLWATWETWIDANEVADPALYRQTVQRDIDLIPLAFPDDCAPR